ncbi:LOW QUALITY PROTEIN: sorting nexin 2A-like [Phoenix dactylifera]|uniref:LOW QUALITY PROTEIN: sorting nexin 2A-like n=1 Tax=Phoenix dactylifera TaxID=42345 RepID=A0A8B7CZH9_PHODC|nr:LOW QUALITY PROTEIN: sorting nexin 2A-like [Phoenix dactylifera]
MMGPETHPGFGSPRREKMESLVLSDGPSDYRSAMSSSLSARRRRRSPPLTHSPLSTASSSSFLDPPSYADVVFSPLDSQNGAALDCPSHRRESSSPRSDRDAVSEYAKITVSDPQKEQDAVNSLVPGGGTYVTYLITSRTRAGGAEFRVRRRFRDVVTLADRLAEAYRGYFIPPRPDKNVVESQVMQKHEFVEQRRSAIEKYLWRLAVHPGIGKSEELRVFLQAQGKLPLPAITDMASRMLDGAVRLPKQLFGEGPAGHVTPQDAVQPAKGGRDLLRIFKELKQSVANDWGGAKPPVVEEDKEFLERKEKMQDLEQQLSTASQQAEALVKAQQDIGETMGQLGLAFIKLTKFENEEAIYNSQRVRVADAKSVATAAVKASRLYRELNAQTVKHLDTLHECLGLMLAVNSAFSDRANALLTVQTLKSDLSSLHTRIDKLEAASSKIFGGDRSRMRKVEELKETMRVTEDAKCGALREYERIKENNRSELERLDRERHDDFLSMLKGFVINQVGYAEKIANVWAAVAEETSAYARP